MKTRDLLACAAISHDDETFTSALAAVPEAPPLPGDEISQMK